MSIPRLWFIWRFNIPGDIKAVAIFADFIARYPTCKCWIRWISLYICVGNTLNIRGGKSILFTIFNRKSGSVNE